MPFTKTYESDLDRIADELMARFRELDDHPLTNPATMTFAEMERAVRMVTETAVATKSFAQAARVIAVWSGQTLLSRNVTRVVEEVWSLGFLESIWPTW
jgi:hypothetical protein